MLRFQCLASDGVAGKEKPYQAVVEWFPSIGALSVFKGSTTPTRFARDPHGVPTDGSPAVRGARLKALQLQMHVSELINLLPSGSECGVSPADVPADGELHFLGVVRHSAGKSEFTPRMLRLSVERHAPTLAASVAVDPNAAALHLLYRDLLHALLPYGRLHFTALISPISGKGEGLKIWTSFAAPVIAASPHTCSVVSTTHRGHAEEYAAEAELKPNEVIVAVGGDGMAHEVINGYRRRLASSGGRSEGLMPRVATFPTGSGCALAKTLGVIKPIDAALALVSSHSLEMDVMDLHFEPAPRLIPGKTEKDPRQEAPAEELKETDRTAFLSVSMCFGAAVDLESEKYRWMGNNRFAFYAVKKLISNVPKYPLTIRYKPALVQDIHPNLLQSTGATPETPLATHGSIAQHVKPFDFRVDAVAGRSTDLSSSLLPTAANNDDDGWVNIDQSEYTFMIVCNIPWIAKDMLAAPYSHVNDRCVDLIYAAPDITRAELIKSMIDMEEGKHVQHSKLRYVKCREVEVTPRDGLMSIDGERFPLAKVTAKVSDARVRIIHAPVVATPAECEPLVIAACIASLAQLAPMVATPGGARAAESTDGPLVTARAAPSPRGGRGNRDEGGAAEEMSPATSPTTAKPPQSAPTGGGFPETTPAEVAVSAPPPSQEEAAAAVDADAEDGYTEGIGAD